MAYSYVRYTGNGSTTNYTFPFPYISTDHIKVRVNATLVTNWSFLSSSTIQFATAPTSGAVIEIRRETPKESAIVNFTDGSVLLERDLDLLATYSLYLAQETKDGLESGMNQDSLGVWQAQNYRIANVADPVNAQDAATKAWAETAGSSFVGAAAASATAASTSASNASSSATAAAGSASAASGSATAAASSATAASGSQTAAATSATNAANSATAASGSASTATTAASTATTQATNAAGSATAASGSATAAASSASAAATSAADAASSAASTAALLDSFDDRYLGPKATAPTLDNDGNALVIGALYFDSTSGKMRVYTATGWVDASSAAQAALTAYRYNATAGQTTFSGADANGLTLAYLSGGIVVVLNGSVLVGGGVDYTATNGTSIVLAVGATVGDTLEVYAFASFSVANTYTKAEVDTFLAGKEAANANIVKKNVATGYTAQQYGVEATLTDAATVAWDVSAAQVAKVTLGGNRTFGAPTNQIAGAFYGLLVTQDGTGSRTGAWNSVFKFPQALAPVLTTTANAKDFFVFRSDGTNMNLVGRSMDVR